MIENIALFDMDGTLCDYNKALFKSLNLLRSPAEPLRKPDDDSPQYLHERANLIRSKTSWWASIPKFKLGFDIWDLTKELKFRNVILTQGPRRNPNAWSGKKIWIDKNLGTDTDMIITRDKGLVYGKILVDDWPEYILRWLKWRPRGLAIMPASKDNVNFRHEQVIRYTGRNFKQVATAISIMKERT